MSKLWKKTAGKLHPLVEKYTVGNDPILDLTLFPYDLQGTTAHVKGLEKIGILNKPELKKVLTELENLQKLWKKNQITITFEDEDCHTVIENYLTKKLGDIGKKVHTGRSRNDQVLTAIRLYMKDQLKNLEKSTKKLAANFLKSAEKYAALPFPGYSHTQQAMLTSLGHYYLSFVESLIDDCALLEKIQNQIDKNPLGSAAGFGVSLALPRNLTTQELHFKETQINSLYCQNSRGKFESLYLEGLSQIMMTLSKFANDLILFTSQEFNFFTVKDELVTGSSIMPQKRNLDAMEILRGQTSVIFANQQMIKDISKSLLSGYNRDLQLIKKPLIESTEILEMSLEIVEIYLKGITPNEDEILKKINPAIFTADIAIELAKKGMPFREAYKKALAVKEEINLQKNIASKISLGGPGNLNLPYYKKQLKIKP